MAWLIISIDNLLKLIARTTTKTDRQTNKENLLELISDCKWVTGHKVNTKVNFFPIYQQLDNWNLKWNTIHIVSLLPSTVKRKYLVINVTKCVLDLDVENYKTLIKVINKDLNEWKDILC